MPDDANRTAPRPVGAIEAGGTKFVCAVGTGPDDIRADAVIATTTPSETLRGVMDFLLAHSPLGAIGVGSFGPLDLDPRSRAFGSITNTPKPGWADTPLIGALSPLGLPLAIDTDVNAAALGEHRWGALRGVTTGVYLTVGTGIGGGGVVNGRLMRGLVHPEMGHVLVPHDHVRDPFRGVCPFHGDCLEGLASGVAMRERWGAAAEALPPDHPAWELEAHYLGLGLAAIVTILSPERIVVGGGVAQASGLLARVRTSLAEHLGGYVRARAVWGAGADYVVPPALGDRSGMLGAMALALDAITPSSSAART